MIQVSNVSMSYKEDIEILHQISFHVEKGEFAFLVGPSGAGKTTVLRLLYRELEPDSGQIVVVGKYLTKVSNSELPYIRRKMGIVFQDFKLLPNKTVEQNIALAMKVTGASRPTINKKVDQLLEQMKISHRREAFPEEISGGEQQRVSIARAMANDPALLMADEPTGNLDPKLSLEIMNMFEEFNYRGTTVLVATHDTALVNQLGKRVIKLENGRIE